MVFEELCGRVGFALTILRRCHGVNIGASLRWNGNGKRVHLSPRPWATMTVEVCLLRAGTTSAALLDMIVCGVGG